MHNAARFDRYASRYAEMVNAAIATSGEDVEYFAGLKAHLLRAALSESQPRALLDFGCGIGTATRAIRLALPAIPSIVGVDPSIDSVHRAREYPRRNERITYEISGDDRLPFADEAFDIVFTSCVFHHIDRADHQHWLREIRRVLSPDGQFFLFEHNPYNPLTQRAVRECPFDEGVVLLHPGYARAALGSAGFRADPPHYYFFFPRALRFLRRHERRLSRIPLGAQYFVRAWRT